jgi:N-sulfoglucosamine sulfohydrolase|tara:strand:- start:90 stop:1751 length:1662 start_codon:yes stop_codon:yes gene_type:complete
MSILFKKLFLNRTVSILILSLLFSCKFSKKPIDDNTTPIPKTTNILWLVTEDMGQYLPSFGDNTVLTPNLNRLAAEGIKYPNVFSPSGVCAPSRAAISTGMYPSSIGANHMRTTSYTEVTGLPKYEAIPPPEVKMFSELLRKQGYYCTNNAKNDYQFKAPVTSWDQNGKKAHWKNRAQGQPFFSIFNFNVTHESGLFEPYERAIAIPENIEFSIPPYLPDTRTVRRDLWKMYNNIALMDQQIGKVLKELEEGGLLENTIVFFYSDHGGPLPRQKRLVYDSGLKVPMIIRFPNKINAGTQDDQLISFVDFAPTVLALSGQVPPNYLQGQTFIEKKQIKRKYIHAASDRFDGFTDVIRAVRDRRFKYIRNYRTEQGYYLPVSYREQIPTMKELIKLRDEGSLNEVQSQWFREKKPKEELFDCLKDPHEINNLANQTKYQNKLIELRSEMDRWLNEIDDQPNLPERELINQLWGNKKEKPKTTTPVVSVTQGEITIECETKGASIGYRIIGENSSPSAPYKVYTVPFKNENGNHLEIIAHRIGFEASNPIKYASKF